MEDSTSQDTLPIVATKIDIGTETDPFGHVGEYFIYASISENYNDTAGHTYWKYEFSTKNSTRIDIFTNKTTSSGEYAFLRDRVFFTSGCVQDGEHVNLHCEIDLTNNALKVLSEDDSFPPLIKEIPVNDKHYLEFQPERIADGMYRYNIRIGDLNGGIKDIITKEHKTARELDGTIASTCIYNDLIYTFEYRGNDEPYVCTYDLEGREISIESIDLLTAFLNTPDPDTGDEEALWDIDVYDNYYVFTTLNRARLAVKKVDGKYEKVDLLSQKHVENVWQTTYIKHNQKILFRDKIEQKFFFLNTQTGEFEYLNIEKPEEIGYVIYDGSKMLYMNEERIFLFSSIITRPRIPICLSCNIN